MVQFYVYKSYFLYHFSFGVRERERENESDSNSGWPGAFYAAQASLDFRAINLPQLVNVEIIGLSHHT